MSLFRGRFLAALELLSVLALFPGRLHAGTGVGIEGGAAVPLLHGNGTPIMLALTFKTDRLPFILSGRAQLNGSQLSAAGLDVDFWMDDIQIGYSVFSFYYGPGVSLLFHNSVDGDSFSQATGIFVAPRFFAGISTMLSSFSEMYLQAAVEPGIVLDEAEGFIFRVNLPLSVGLRFWF